MTTAQGVAHGPSGTASRWTEQAGVFARVAKALAFEVKLDRLFPQIVGLATEVLHADRSSLFLYDRDRDELWSTVSQGLGRREIRFPASQGLAGAVLASGRPLVVADAYRDPRFDRRWDDETGYRTRSMLAAPVRGRGGDVLGVIQVLNRRGGDVFSATDVVLIETFAAHVATALERSVLVEAYVDRERMQAAMGAARDVQRALLPKRVPAPDTVDIAAYLAPADLVGGDFYEYFPIDAHRLGFAVGDVAGKGIPAALQMASVQTLLRAFGSQGLAPERCLDLVKQTHRGAPAMFTSLVYGVLDTSTGQVEYCNAGHHPPVLLRSGEPPRMLVQPGQLPLSPFSHPYTARTVRLEPGDGLVLYTDGVVEAEARDRAPFGEARLLSALCGLDGEDAEGVVHRVLAALEAFAGLDDRRDDCTVLVLRARGQHTHANRCQ